MQSFIKHHMRTILQPFQDDLHALSDRVAQLANALQQTDANAANMKQALDGTNTDLLNLRGNLDDTRGYVGKLHEGLQTSAQNHEALQQGLELTNHFAQRMHTQLESTTSLAQELQHDASGLECEMQALRANLQRTDDYVAADVAGRFDKMGAELQDLQDHRAKSSMDAEQLRADLDQTSHLVNDTRKVLDKNNIDTAGLKKSVEAIMSREAHLGARVEDWKHQWSKLHPHVEALRKDSAYLKQQTEHQGSLIHGLQQSAADNFSHIETTQQAQEKLHGQVQGLQQGLSTAEHGLGVVQDKLAKLTTLTNGMYDELQKDDSKLHAIDSRLDAQEEAHTALSGRVERVNEGVTELWHNHKKAATSMQATQHELAKTNEGVKAVWDQIGTTNANLSNLEGEMGRANETLQKLKYGVDHCHAEFTGLQKGFMDTSTHVTNRPAALPKIAQESDGLSTSASSRRPSLSTEGASRPRSNNSGPMTARRSTSTASPH